MQRKTCSQNNKQEIGTSEEGNRIIWNFDKCLLSQYIDTDSSKERKIETIQFDSNSQFLAVDIIEDEDYRDDSGADEKSPDGVYAATTENNSTTVIVKKGNASIMRFDFQEGKVWDIAFSPDNRWIAIAVNNIQEDLPDNDARAEFGTGEIFLYAMPEVLLKDVREKLTNKIKK